ncbi:MAG: ERCC4 domain-containing protein [candidate division WOR-3 bacterium]
MGEERTLKWLLYQQVDEKFPYKLYIEVEPDKFLCLNTQERWPGPGKKIYCHPNGFCNAENLPAEEPLEKCNIIAAKRYGRRLVIALDRKTKKRCWFVFIKKEYKTRPGEFYEQVFWITQSSEAVRRPGAYVPKVREDTLIEIIIDKREHYPYKFGYTKTKRENLPVGDYALIKDGKIVAIAERKSLDNFLNQVSTYDSFKAILNELATYPYKALILEAPYSDFLNPRKIKPYRASYIAGILSDLAVRFPTIQIVFCDNRKFAQEWLLRWFLRIDAEDG